MEGRTRSRPWHQVQRFRLEKAIRRHLSGALVDYGRIVLISLLLVLRGLLQRRVIVVQPRERRSRLRGGVHDDGIV